MSEGHDPSMSSVGVRHAIAIVANAQTGAAAHGVEPLLDRALLDHGGHR